MTHRPVSRETEYVNDPEMVVVGSANLDLVVTVPRIPLAGETILGGDLQQIPGGKGANQAVAAARLGRSVSMVGRVGDDDAARLLRSAIQDAGVEASCLTSTAGVPSGTALISVASDGENSIVVSPGANARVSAEDVVAASPFLNSAALVLLQLEVPVEAVVEAASQAAGTVVVNPAPAPAGTLPEALLERTDVLVPNQSELATLASLHGGLTIDPHHNQPETLGIDDAVSMARSLPCETVVVTLGSQGAVVVRGRYATHIAAPVVTPVDTTAAGDAFCAGLSDALIAGADHVEATRWAVRVGAAATLRAGAQPSLPTRRQVSQLLSR